MAFQYVKMDYETVLQFTCNECLFRLDISACYLLLQCLLHKNQNLGLRVVYLEDEGWFIFMVICLKHPNLTEFLDNEDVLSICRISVEKATEMH